MARKGTQRTARAERAGAERKLVRLTELAALAEVPAATVKHYVREGLITVTKKPSRNLGLYDAGLVGRIRAIKALQKSRFVPLDVIKELIDQGVDITDDDGAAAAIARTLERIAPREHKTRAGLLASGMPPDQLALLKAYGLLQPARSPDGEEVYTGDDVELLRVLGKARKLGLSPEMLPISIIETYVTAIRQLVKAEVQLFRAGVLPRAGVDLAAVTTAATELSERLVVLIRRKLLLPTMRGMADEPRKRPPRRR